MARAAFLRAKALHSAELGHAVRPDSGRTSIHGALAECTQSTVKVIRMFSRVIAALNNLMSSAPEHEQLILGRHNRGPSTRPKQVRRRSGCVAPQRRTECFFTVNWLRIAKLALAGYFSGTKRG